MQKSKKWQNLDQLNAKLKSYAEAGKTLPPEEGWIREIRNALNMTLDQLAKKIGIKSPSLKAFEIREKQGTITLNSIKQIANALDMQLVYAIIPKKGNLEDIVDVKAWEKAKEIVTRTANTMALENQAISSEKLKQNLEDKKNELKNDIPKFLRDLNRH